ncbi:MAG TPA: VWA domain-containing protein [Candidatus Eremiobacteraeota bacterium]|mgnify:CR=1 FL=1|nr:VWA domain-containing protein [Candidatus Eremiobacteraeota bacterium]
MRRIPIYLLIDCSIYMTGKPVDAVKEGIKNLVANLKREPFYIEKVYLSIITFSSAARQDCPLTDINHFKEPLLFTRGACDPGEAFKLLKQCMEREVKKTTSITPGDFKPLVIFILGSKPVDNWEGEVEQSRQNHLYNLMLIPAGSLTKSLDEQNLITDRVKPDVLLQLQDLYGKILIDTLNSYYLDDKPVSVETEGISSEIYEETANISPSDYSEIPDNELQRLIEATKDSETLELFPKEYAGPVIIKKGLTINGRGATIWSLKGPVLIVQSFDVNLRNLRIEVTGEQSETKAQCAIIVSSPGTLFEDIEVRGLVMGLREEEGKWNYPNSLYLGQLASGTEYDFIIKINVPVTCNIASNISGLEVKPHSLSPGLNEINLHIDYLPKDTLISGYILLSTARIKRKIMVNGYIMSEQSQLTEYTPPMIIWEPPVSSPSPVKIVKKEPARARVETPVQKEIKKEVKIEIPAREEVKITVQQQEIKPVIPEIQIAKDSRIITKKSVPISQNLFAQKEEKIDPSLLAEKTPSSRSIRVKPSTPISSIFAVSAASSQEKKEEITQNISPSPPSVKIKPATPTSSIFGEKSANVPEEINQIKSTPVSKKITRSGGGIPKIFESSS